jgi:hypothetical protein
MFGGQNWHSYAVPFSAVFKRHWATASRYNNTGSSRSWCVAAYSLPTRDVSSTSTVVAIWSVIEEKLPYNNSGREI